MAHVIEQRCMGSCPRSSGARACMSTKSNKSKPSCHARRRMYPELTAYCQPCIGCCVVLDVWGWRANCRHSPPIQHCSALRRHRQLLRPPTAGRAVGQLPDPRKLVRQALGVSIIISIRNQKRVQVNRGPILDSIPSTVQDPGSPAMYQPIRLLIDTAKFSCNFHTHRSLWLPSDAPFAQSCAECKHSTASRPLPLPCLRGYVSGEQLGESKPPASQAVSMVRTTEGQSSGTCMPGSHTPPAAPPDPLGTWCSLRHRPPEKGTAKQDRGHR
eukprot:scaffold228215_cov21-Tisochrysis_lutea.AAC.4